MSVQGGSVDTAEERADCPSVEQRKIIGKFGSHSLILQSLQSGIALWGSA
jgi:hypothetical protein